jgi:arginyl-tRNA--protein-N-Asp/Glu arginylyltransferase
MTVNFRKPDLYLSMPHPCSYLAGRTSTILFVDPRFSANSEFYGLCVQQGYRRSGDLIYRPYCRECNACVPVRVPVADFQPTRGQRRVWARNDDLTISAHPAGFNPEHFALYRRYQECRHTGSSMDDPDPEKYLSFLLSRSMDTCLYEFRAPVEPEPSALNTGMDSDRPTNGRLLAVAVVDLLPDGLSAMYTFFDPRERARALGIYAILWEIAEARRQGLDHLYLGYWIGECAKMAYKSNFHPLESLREGRWLRG